MFHFSPMSTNFTDYLPYRCCINCLTNHMGSMYHTTSYRLPQAQTHSTHTILTHNTHIHIHTTDTHTHTQHTHNKHKHTHICTHTNTHTQTHTHSHTHTYTHTHTHTHTYTIFLDSWTEPGLKINLQ